MSTIERIEVTCDVPHCIRTVITSLELTGHGEQGWLIGNTIDLCPQHASASGLIAATRDERAAPPAAPTAGTTSTEGITFTIPARDTVWVAAAIESYVATTGRDRELIRHLHAQIEDYARSQP